MTSWIWNLAAAAPGYYHWTASFFMQTQRPVRTCFITVSLWKLFCSLQTSDDVCSAPEAGVWSLGLDRNQWRSEKWDSEAESWEGPGGLGHLPSKALPTAVPRLSCCCLQARPHTCTLAHNLQSAAQSHQWKWATMMEKIWWGKSDIWATHDPSHNTDSALTRVT